MITMTAKTIHLKNGSKIEALTLTNLNGIEVEILTQGAIIKSIKTPDKAGEFENILIEFQDINTYIENPGYINALIGRTAGRIHKAEVSIHGREYKFAKNDGNNTLHGGLKGLDKKIWSYKDVSTQEVSAVELSCFSPDAEEGYPGNLEIKVTYSLSQDNVFTLYYEGISDQDTLINLTNHAYFNLSGNAKRPITDQELMIKSSYVCELDSENIVTGKFLDVREHSAFDFTTPKPVGRDIDQDHIQLRGRRGYDHPWVLDNGTGAVTLYDPLSGRQLEVSTDQKTVVVYSMNWGSDVEYTNGKKNITRYGITFEAQSYPVGHDQCFKEDSLVGANEKYTQTTSFKFTLR